MLEFVKATYYEHKDDTPQKTVFVRSEIPDIDLNKFFTQMHDDRIVHVDNRLFEKFIKTKIKQPPIQVKKLLFDKHLIIKSIDGKRFTRNKGASSIPCVGFYAEPLQLSDRDEHLML